ncbi:MAG TPA: serine hydrolase domain-containing protein [Chitinophagaceae bacterium]|nr:serine hydrolase domain-containing protein [Chitinophagaceae bacterium]
MKKILIALICISFFACRKAQIVQTRSVGEEVPWNDSSSQHPKNAALDALLKKYQKKGLPGISLLVNDRNGTWVGATGKADIDNNIDFVPGTVSKAASITKLLVGTLVFKLMEDSIHTGIGYNDLNTKINHWLPQRIINRIANGNEVTLGQCMKHETGIPDLIEENSFYLAVLNNPNKKWQPEELLSYIFDKPALFGPSDTAVYSNTNYVLVSMIIEAQTGRNHSDLLKELILNPLGMTHTYYQPHDELPNEVAQGYFDLYNNNTIVNVSNLVTGSGNGYGGIYSNVFDLFKFADALFIKKTLLKPSSLAIMQTWGKRDGSNLYGYGIQKSFLDKDIDAGIGHKGRDVGYSANLFYFPNKGVTHIFFVNYGTDGDSHLRQTFYDFIDELVSITVN